MFPLSGVTLLPRILPSFVVKTEAADHLFSKAPVADALGFLCYQVEEFMGPASKVKIEEQPLRTVKAIRAFGAGELVFAPDTAKITTVKPGEKVPDQLEVKYVAKKVPTELRFFLSPAVANDNVGAFWCVRGTAEKEEANMERKLVTRRCVASLAFDTPIVVTAAPPAVDGDGEASRHNTAAARRKISGKTAPEPMVNEPEPKVDDIIL